MLTHTTAGRHTQHTVSQEPRQHKADIRRNTTTRHSTVAHTVTASETQHGYTRNHSNRTHYDTNSLKQRGTQHKYRYRRMNLLILINARCSQVNESHPRTQYKNRSLRKNVRYHDFVSIRNPNPTLSAAERDETRSLTA